MGDQHTPFENITRSSRIFNRKGEKNTVVYADGTHYGDNKND